MFDEGVRITGPLFNAVCCCETGGEGAKIGFAVGRAAGNAVARNRIRRRLREAVRLHLGELGSGWRVVFTPRRALLDAEFGEVEGEVVRVFRRCGNR